MPHKLVSKPIFCRLHRAVLKTVPKTDQAVLRTDLEKEVGRRAVKNHHTKRNISSVAGIDRAMILSGQTNFPGYAMWLTMNLNRQCSILFVRSTMKQ